MAWSVEADRWRVQIVYWRRGRRPVRIFHTMCTSVLSNEDYYSGAYIAMTIVSLLNLPLEIPDEEKIRLDGITSLVDRLPEYIRRCIGSASTSSLVVSN